MAQTGRLAVGHGFSLKITPAPSRLRRWGTVAGVIDDPGIKPQLPVLLAVLVTDHPDRPGSDCSSEPFGILITVSEGQTRQRAAFVERAVEAGGEAAEDTVAAFIEARSRDGDTLVLARSFVRRRRFVAAELPWIGCEVIWTHPLTRIGFTPRLLCRGN